MDSNRLGEQNGTGPKKYYNVRWYDYVVAFMVADFMTGLLFAGSFYVGPSWWVPALYGLCAGLLYKFYTDCYCQIRKRMEDNGR